MKHDAYFTSKCPENPPAARPSKGSGANFSWTERVSWINFKQHPTTPEILHPKNKYKHKMDPKHLITHAIEIRISCVFFEFGPNTCWLLDTSSDFWLVVYPTLWKIWKSNGTIIPNVWKNRSPGWWCNNHLEKYESQIGSSSQPLGKIKKVWNHQPVTVFFARVFWAAHLKAVPLPGAPTTRKANWKITTRPIGTGKSTHFYGKFQYQ